jgi:hypothetical protein
MKKNPRYGASAAEAPAPTASRPSSLVQRLLGGWRRRQAARELPPAGQRSGEGTDSLAPYLEQGRSSRPAPLE